MSEWGKKGDLSSFERGMVVHNLLSYWDFHTQPFLGFTKNAVKREKHPVCDGSPVGENALLENGPTDSS